VTSASLDSACLPAPRWQKLALLVASLQCLIWGGFIILLPVRSSASYGLAEVPREIFLWQGTGLVIFLYGVGYWIASTNPRKHWSVILIGLMAKTLGPVGIAWSVWQRQIPGRVLLLIPINDIVWWVPFSVILWQVYVINTKRTEL
jgi:small multidrug resistance pump